MKIFTMSMSTVVLALAIQGCTPHHHHPHPKPQLQKASFSTAKTIPLPSSNSNSHNVHAVTAAGQQETTPTGTSTMQFNSAGGNMPESQGVNPTSSQAAAAVIHGNTTHGDDHGFTPKFWEAFILKGLELVVNVSARRHF